MSVKVKSSEYKTSLINNRRYLGNKYKLLPFIMRVVTDECADIDSIADILRVPVRYHLLLPIRQSLPMI